MVNARPEDPLIRLEKTADLAGFRKVVRFLVATKDPARVESGRLGARRRWGEPRILRLDSLTSSQRTLVLALVAAAKSIEPNEKAPAATTANASKEVRHATADTTASR